MLFAAAVLFLSGIEASPNLHHSKRIVGGTDVSINQYPYIVQFRDKQLGYICPGTIYNDRYIITAAYCIALARKHSSLANVEVRVGATKLSSGGVSYNVQNWITHPNYNEELLSDNIGLIKLSKSISFSSTVRRATMPYLTYFCLKDYIAGVFAPWVKFTVLGWGKTGSSSAAQTSDNLKKVDLSFILPKSCKTIWGKYYNNEQICTVEDNKGFCDMDNGGPLIYSGVQIGIASFTSTTCAARVPDVYTRLCLYTNWIRYNAL